MSNLRHQKSFSIVVQALDQQPDQPHNSWNFVFGRGDMANMHGSLARLGTFLLFAFSFVLAYSGGMGRVCVCMSTRDIVAEMGGTVGVARTLRSDLRNGLYPDEVEEGTFQNRRSRYGMNVFPKPPLSSFFELCWNAVCLSLSLTRTSTRRIPISPLPLITYRVACCLLHPQHLNSWY